MVPAIPEGAALFVELADPSDVNTEDLDYLQIASFPASAETHGGEDVAAYAFGPNAEALGGVIEQNEIYQIMRTALFGPED